MGTVRQRIALVAIAGVMALASPPATAQQTLNQAQCRQARAVTLDILKRYTGKMSAPLAKSFGRFVENCDVKTQFDTVPGSADDQAFGEFRIKMTVIRTSEGN
jgi:hypothetical protein